MEKKSFLTTLLLSWFVGFLGIHRFYTGYYVIGTIQLLTFGGCGIWCFMDLISICLGKYKDYNGEPLENYDKTIGQIILWINILIPVLILVITIFVFFALISVLQPIIYGM